jgi:hypothetical protein
VDSISMVRLPVGHFNSELIQTITCVVDTLDNLIWNTSLKGGRPMGERHVYYIS